MTHGSHEFGFAVPAEGALEEATESDKFSLGVRLALFAAALLLPTRSKGLGLVLGRKLLLGRRGRSVGNRSLLGDLGGGTLLPGAAPLFLHGRIVVAFGGGLALIINGIDMVPVDAGAAAAAGRAARGAAAGCRAAAAAITGRTAAGVVHMMGIMATLVVTAASLLAAAIASTVVVRATVAVAVIAVVAGTVVLAIVTAWLAAVGVVAATAALVELGVTTALVVVGTSASVLVGSAGVELRITRTLAAATLLTWRAGLIIKPLGLQQRVALRLGKSCPGLLERPIGHILGVASLEVLLDVCKGGLNLLVEQAVG